MSSLLFFAAVLAIVMRLPHRYDLGPKSCFVQMRQWDRAHGNMIGSMVNLGQV